MGRHVSAEESLQEYCAVMGDDLGATYGVLANEFQVLYLEWNEFKELFGTSSERIELLNRSASAFFGRLQSTLWESLLLRIARLTDPTSSGKGRDNATLHRLPGMVDLAIRSDIERLLKIVQDKCEFSRDWRNRRIAHKDLQLALKASEKQLSPASRLSVEHTLAAIVTVLNTIESHYFYGRTTAFSCIQSSFGAKALLFTLQEGLDALAAQESRLRSGELLPEDIARRRRR